MWNMLTSICNVVDVDMMRLIQEIGNDRLHHFDQLHVVKIRFACVDEELLIQLRNVGEKQAISVGARVPKWAKVDECGGTDTGR
jgi:hypothetical protein